MVHIKKKSISSRNSEREKITSEVIKKYFYILTNYFFYYLHYPLKKLNNIHSFFCYSIC